MLYLINPFHGRLKRGGWWGLQLFLILLLWGGILIAMAEFPSNDPNAMDQIGTTENVIVIVLLTITLYANFSTCLNRLRDAGHSGWWYLTFFLPYAGLGLMLYFCGIAKSKHVTHSTLPPDLEDEISEFVQEAKMIADHVQSDGQTPLGKFPGKPSGVSAGEATSSPETSPHSYARPHLRGMGPKQGVRRPIKPHEGFGRRGR